MVTFQVIVHNKLPNGWLPETEKTRERAMRRQDNRLVTICA